MTTTAIEEKGADTSQETAKPIRVAILDHTASMGGGEIALLQFVTRLDRQRFDPLVILFSEGPLGEKLVAAGVRCELFPLNASITDVRKGSVGVSLLLKIPQLFMGVAFIFRLARLIRREKISLVHTNSLKSDILGGIAGRLAFAKVIWHVRDRIDADYLPKTAVTLFRLLARIIPTHVVANSDATLATLRLPTKKREFTIYSGIIASTRQAETVHDGIASEGGSNGPAVNVDTPLIGLVGRISPWKGQHIFIEAAAQVLAKFPRARFQIVGSAMFGEDGYEKEIRELVQKLGVERSVEFTGFRADVREMISKMSILVHASTTGEPFGQVIVEGMAAGRPVVATNGGGVPEIVVDGITGILVPMADAAAMAAAIVKLLENPLLMDEMGKAGQLRAASDFSIEQTVMKIQAVYRYVIGSGRL
jgi:glycosyltransferase involved in cell wall biosynthesis